MRVSSFEGRLSGSEAIETELRNKLSLEWPSHGAEGLWPLAGAGAGLPVLIAWDLDNCRIPDQIDVYQIVRYLLDAFVVLPQRDQRRLQLIVSCSPEAAAKAGVANLTVLQTLAEVLPTSSNDRADQALQQRIKEFSTSEHRRGGGTVVLLGGDAATLCAAKHAEDMGMGLEMLSYAKVRAQELLQVQASASWQCDWVEFLTSWSVIAPLTFPFPVNMVALRRLHDMTLTDMHAYLAHVLSSLSLAEAPHLAPVLGRNDCLLVMLASEHDALMVLSCLTNNDRLVLRVVGAEPLVPPAGPGMPPPPRLRSVASYPPPAMQYTAASDLRDAHQQLLLPPTVLRGDPGRAPSAASPLAAAAARIGPPPLPWSPSSDLWPPADWQAPLMQQKSMPSMHSMNNAATRLRVPQPWELSAQLQQPLTGFQSWDMPHSPRSPSSSHHSMHSAPSWDAPASPAGPGSSRHLPQPFQDSQHPDHTGHLDSLDQVSDGTQDSESRVPMLFSSMLVPEGEAQEAPGSGLGASFAQAASRALESGPSTPPGSDSGPLTIKDVDSGLTEEVNSSQGSLAGSADEGTAGRDGSGNDAPPAAAEATQERPDPRSAADGGQLPAGGYSQQPPGGSRPQAPPQQRVYGSGMTIPPSRVALHVKGFQPGMSDASVKRCVLAAAQQTGCPEIVENAEMVVRLVIKEGVHKGCPYAFVNVRSTAEAEAAAKRMDGFVVGGVRLIATVRKYMEEDNSDRRGPQPPPQVMMHAPPGPRAGAAPGGSHGRVSAYMFPHPPPGAPRPGPVPPRGPLQPPYSMDMGLRGPAGMPRAQQQGGTKPPQLRGVALYVKGFPQNWTEDQVRNCIILAFSCQLPKGADNTGIQPSPADIAVKHHSDGEFRGYPYAFVNYSSIMQAEYAKQVLDNFQFGHNRLTVNVRTYDFPPAAPPPAPLQHSASFPGATLQPLPPKAPSPRPAPGPPQHVHSFPEAGNPRMAVDASRTELYVKPSDDSHQMLDQAALGAAIDAALFSTADRVVAKRLKLRACDGRPCAVLRFADESAAADALGLLSMSSMGGVRLEVAYLRQKLR